MRVIITTLFAIVNLLTWPSTIAHFHDVLTLITGVVAIVISAVYLLAGALLEIME